MSSSWKLSPLLIIALIACIHEGLSIKCWSCRSDFDPACNDEFDNTTMAIVDCNQVQEISTLPGIKATMCRKIRQRVNGVWKIIRDCAFVGEPGVHGDEKLCFQPPKRDRTFIEYCTCNSRDGCNTGTTVHSNQLVIPFSVLLTCFVTRFYNR